MTDARARSQLLFTIGHSNYELEVFIALLKEHRITAIADVRSQPYSRFAPQFNRETLQDALERQEIRYVFLGTQLGARRVEPECYERGKASRELIAGTPAFAEGIARVRRGMAGHRLALMCAEKDPLTCHRTLLVCRMMKDAQLDIRHILEDGRVETTSEAEERLLALAGLPDQELFRSRDELVEAAYRRQWERIACSEAEPTESGATVP